eukprot:gene9630-11803_t
MKRASTSTTKSKSPETSGSEESESEENESEKSTTKTKVYGDVIYELKVGLTGYKSLSRTIHVPKDYTYWDLHSAIQDIMGWKDLHLHQFRIEGKMDERLYKQDINIGSVITFGKDVLDEDKIEINQHLKNVGDTITYTHDLGSRWIHSIRLSNILTRDKSKKYPLCTAGVSKSPEEDTFRAPRNPKDFNYRNIVFTDPEERLKNAFYKQNF